MFHLITEYWILLAAAATFGVGTSWWILSSRRHVELPRIEIGQTATQTLARTVVLRTESDSSGHPPLPFPVNLDHDVHPDNLLRIKGVGPKLARILIDMGITHYAQIAAFSPADIAAVDDRLGVFSGRIGRDNWVEQAHLLEAGDIAGFEAKFGKILGIGH